MKEAPREVARWQEVRIVRPEDLSEALVPERFKPFAINLTNGESYKITHPEQVVVTRSTAFIATRRRKGARYFEKGIMCGLIHIVSLIPLEETEVT